MSLPCALLQSFGLPGVENKDLASGAKNSSRFSKFCPFSGAVLWLSGAVYQYKYRQLAFFLEPKMAPDSLLHLSCLELFALSLEL